MATFANGESGLSVRTKINAVLQHADGSAGELVINDAGADVDFRVESDTIANALFVDGATGNVGLGTSTPQGKLDVSGNSYVSAAGLLAFRNNTPADYGYLGQGSINGGAATDLAIRANLGGISFATNGANERMRIDATGNVGIGVTPSAWGAAFRALQVGAMTSIATESGVASSFINNGFFGGNWAYISSGLGATSYSPYNGAHRWFNAPSGTAGNAITFTQAMTLDASGNLGIGTTVPLAKLDVYNGDIVLRAPNYTTASKIAFGNPAQGTSAAFIQYQGNGDFSGYISIGTNASGNVAATEKIRIAPGGEVGIGTTSPKAKLHVLDQIKVSNAAQSEGALVLGDGGSTAFNVGIARWNGASNVPGSGGVGYFAQGPSNVGGHFFYTGDAAAGSTTERMRISSAGSVGIGTNAPNAAAILDVQSTTLGVRFPNMTTTQKNAIANVAGNVIFDTTLGKLCVNTGSGWQTITSA